MKTILLTVLFVTLQICIYAQQKAGNLDKPAKKSKKTQKVDSLTAVLVKTAKAPACEDCLTTISEKTKVQECIFDENDIIYDAKTKQLFQVQKNSWTVINNLKAVQHIRYNHKLRVRVINVNRYNYNVGLVANDVLQVSDQAPAVFDELFLGGDTVLQAVISSAASGLGASAKAEDTALKTLVTDYDALKKGYDKLLEDWIDAYSYCLPESLPCCSSKAGVGDLFTSFNSDVRKVQGSYYAALKDVQGKIKVLEGAIKKEEASISAEKAKIADLEKENLDKKTTPARKKQILADIKNQEGRIGAFESNLTSQEQFKAEREEQKKQIEKIGEFLFGLSEAKLLRLAFHKKNRLYNHLIYNSPPIYPTGNSVKIGIEITPRDSSLVVKWNGYPLEHDSIGFELPVSRRLNFSFSSGLFVGLSSAFKKEEYFWQAQPNAGGLIQDSTQYKLVSRGQSAKPIGLAGFANAIYKINPNFGLGGSVGAGVTLEKKSRAAYFLGTTMQIGHLQQINLTFGAALMRSEKMDKGLYPDATYKTRPSNPEYRSTNEYGWFFSVSYSIFSLSEKKNTISK